MSTPATDSRLAGGPGAAPGRRMAAVLLMCAGAGIGAFLLLVVNGVATHRGATSSAGWTRGAGPTPSR